MNRRQCPGVAGVKQLEQLKGLPAADLTELRSGYACSWCERKQNLLMLVPHPMSPVKTRQLAYPLEAEIVGRVTGVAMRIAEMSPPPAPSASP